MRVDLLQSVALCCYGNEYLSDPESVPIPELHPVTCAFRTSYEIAFERRGGATTLDMVPESTSAWFKQLRFDGAEKLFLNLEKCALEPTKQGEDKWGVAVDGDRSCELWQPSMRMRSYDKMDATPCLVVHYGERFNRWSLGPTRSKTDAAVAYVENFNATREICFKNRFESLIAPLDRCLALHTEANQEMGGFKDLCPANYPGDAKALLASALRALALVSSPTWNQQNVLPESKVDFANATLKVWRASRSAFEAAATSGLQKEAPSTAHGYPLQESA